MAGRASFREVALVSVNFHEIERMQHAGTGPLPVKRWPTPRAVCRRRRRLHRACTNTMHKVRRHRARG